MNQTEFTQHEMNDKLQLVGAVDQGTSSSRFLVRHLNASDIFFDA